MLDLGCGDGDLVLPLLDLDGVTHVTALERDRVRLAALRNRLAGRDGRVRLVHGSAVAVDGRLAGFDVATLVEVIEHLSRPELDRLCPGLFGVARPARVIVTTPNAEFNPLLDVPARRFRHPDHRFEWTRADFGTWARTVAARHGYAVACSTVAGAHPDLGGASQMAIFDSAAGAPARGPISATSADNLAMNRTGKDTP